MSAEEDKKKQIARVVAAYKELFTDPQKTAAAEIVLSDLCDVCRIFSTGRADDHGGLAEFSGRREVFIHVKNMIGLRPDDIERMVMMRDTELTEQRERPYDPKRGGDR